MPNFRSDILNVTLEYEGKPKTLFKNKKVTFDADGGILLAPLLDQIKESGFSLAGHVVSYYSHSDKILVFIGKDPISEDFSIMPYELNPQEPLAINLRPIAKETQIAKVSKP